MTPRKAKTPAEAVAVLRASRPSEGEYAARGFGGITLYAPSEADLDSAISVVAAAIDASSIMLASMDRRSLKHLIKEHFAIALDDRVFSALVGSRLRAGAIDAVPCAATSGKWFWVYVACSRWAEFHDSVDKARAWLRERGRMTVGELRQRLFPKGGWGTWSAALHVLARLALTGAAVFEEDGKAVRWPRGLDRAIG